MIRRALVAVTLLSLLAGTCPLPAQAADPLAVTTAELGARLRLLSSDLFEGRYPGSRGEALTTAYLVSELAGFGLRPGAAAGDSSAWLQPVSILTHEGDSTSPNEARLSGRMSGALEHGRDIRFANFGATGEVHTGGDLVFAGYGIAAPMYGWDDLAGVDLHGKVVIAMLGEPDLPGDTIRFNGPRASRYAWLTGKVREMGRRGAVGVLWVRPAGTLSHAPVNGARRLVGDSTAAGLAFTGLLTDSALARLLPPDAPALGALLAAAARPAFRPVPLGVRLDVDFRTRPVVIHSHNVIGTIPGTDPRLAAEHVVLSAHWDAFGIGSPVNGDSIYNGALDDGSGTTVLLALARVLARHPQRRSITFLFSTAEEMGLLGAQAFICGGPLPPERIVANLNLDDGIELMGVKRDVAPLGIELSTLGQTVRDVAAGMRLRVSPDPYAAEGFFLRADNFPFALAGVPSLYMALGTDAVGVAPDFVDAKVKEYMSQHYHRPSDEYAIVVLDLAGSRQFADFAGRVAIAVASAPARPRWLPGAEFQRPATPGCAR